MTLTYRIRVVYDEDPDLSWLEKDEQEYEEWGPILNNDMKPMSYEEWRETHGNPDNHINFGVIAEKQCECCGSWVKHGMSSCWGIDYCVLYNKPIPEPGIYYSLDDLEKWGYIYEIAAECVAELEGAGDVAGGN